MTKAQMLIRSAIPVLALAMLLAAPMTARADSDDQERAREAMLAGDVRPLTELLAHVESMYAGEVIEVELEEDEIDARFGSKGKTVLLYEIKLLTPQGNLVKLKFDAKNLELLTVDGHDSESARKDHGDKNDD